VKGIEFFLNVGSSKISLVAVSPAKTTPVIIASSSQLYDGFMDGEFFDSTQVTDAVQKLFAEMTSKLKVKIKKVYVGVPAEFSVCVCKRKVRKFLSVKKINQNLTLELFDGVEDVKNIEEYKLISFSPMCYTLDSGLKTLEPVGKRSSQISLDSSYILVKKSFVSKFDKVLINLGVKQVEYVSTILGQALSASKQDGLDSLAIVDVGHLTTEVAILKGEGLALLSSFSLGGGHITADIMQLLKQSYQDAELIKRKVLLTVIPQKNEKYIVNNKDRQILAPISITNDIVRSRIENIARIIDNILDVDKSFEDIPIYLTGDGISNFKGVITILEKITKRKLIEFKLPFDNSINKFQTSSLGIAEIINRLS